MKDDKGLWERTKDLARDAAHEAKEEVLETRDKVREKGSHAAHVTKNKIEDLSDSARDKVAHVADKVSEKVSKAGERIASDRDTKS